jgi:Tol biopolymer transport system component
MRRRSLTVAGIVTLAAAVFVAAALGGKHDRFGAWENAAPIAGPVNTNDVEGCPMVSPSGKELYFASNRAGGVAGNAGNDIWISKRGEHGEPWGEPVNAGEPINSPFSDYCPSPGKGKDFLFVSTRPTDSDGTASCGGADIYMLEHEHHGPDRAVNLGCTINSAGAEWSPYLLEEKGKTYLFFSSDGGSGDQDIYMSRKGKHGFETPVALAALNTEYDDTRPNLRKDGLEIVFDSNRPGGASAAPDVYSSSRASLHDDWDAPTRIATGGVNSEAGESRASFSWDGKTLYFGSARLGSSDIFSATRDKLGKDD